MNGKTNQAEARGFFSQESISMSSAHLREDNPDIKGALARLVAEGHSRDWAKEMVARALAVEMDGMFNQGHPFDTDRFRRNLAALPKEPTG